MAAAIAGGAAPFITNEIAKLIPEMNTEGRTLAHAAVNAALAAVQGKDMAVAAAGAATGELVGKIAKDAYGKDVSQLSETDKQTVSALATLASALAGGLIGGGSADTLVAAQTGKVVAENNTLSAPVPAPVPVPGIPISPGDKVTQQANDKIATGLDGLLGSVSDALDKATECSFGCACASDMDEQDSQPNAGKNLTDEQKKEYGGTGSGSPDGWGPEDEESGRDGDSLDPKNRAQYEEYVDSLRASMEKPSVKDENLKNIISDLYRPNAKVGSGSTADAVRY